MIKSFRHIGLQLFFEEDNPSKLPGTHINKDRSILTRLAFATSLEDINIPGSRLHALSGEHSGFYAVNVSLDWRIIFRFEDGNVYDVDYLDSH